MNATTRFLRARFLNWFRRKPPPSGLAEFTDLTKRYPSDKWSGHSYGPHYYSHFQAFQSKSINLLEIGVGGYVDENVGYSDPSAGGHSLRFWKAFFPNANIFAIDIEDKSPLQEPRIAIFQGSQTDEQFLREIVEEIGTIDIVIDDGSHVNQDVIATFKFLFPRLSDDGIYVVEDTQTSYWPSEGAHQYGGDSEDLNNPNTMMGFFKGLVDGLNHAEYLRPGYSPTFYDQHIAGIHFYHNLVFVQKGANTEPSNMVKNHQLP